MDLKKIVDDFTSSEKFKNNTEIIDTLKILDKKYGYLVSENLLLIMHNYMLTQDMNMVNLLPIEMRIDFMPIIKCIDEYLEHLLN